MIYIVDSRIRETANRSFTPMATENGNGQNSTTDLLLLSPIILACLLYPFAAVSAAVQASGRGLDGF